MENSHLKSVRKDYQRRALMEADTANDPMQMFGEWLEEAKKADPIGYNAMTLSTVGEEGFPHSRIVLLRNIEEQGLYFFTNYNSDKAKEMENHSKVGLNFFWQPLEQQVRIRGTVEKTSREISDDYFASRPRESQIGAWASDQSSRIDSREELENLVAEYTRKFKNKKVPRPPFWGGFKVTPVYFEFWRGRQSRLHDRFVYRLGSDGDWLKQRLAP